MTDEIICTLENNDDINVSIEDREEVGTSVDNTLVVVDPDHTKLTNRDVPDQHPISAITGLESALSSKADKSTTYTKTETDSLLDTKADKSTTYTKTETDSLLDTKADKSTTYTKTEVNAFLSDKADKATTYTKTETDTLLNAKQDVIDSSHKLSASLVDGLSNVATSGDYDDLTDKPQINSVTLSGNKTTTELKIGIDEFVAYVVDRTTDLPTQFLSGTTALVLNVYTGTGNKGFYNYANGTWSLDGEKTNAIFKGMTVYRNLGNELYVCINRNGSNFSFSKVTDPNKQDKLVSGENIKTINNESILGSGNIELTTDVVVRSETMPLSATTLIWIDTSVTSLITADNKNFITADNKNFIVRS